MQNLTQASEELFRRGPDECFATFDDLWRHCQQVKAKSADRWHSPSAIQLDAGGGRLGLSLGDDGKFRLNEWSFSQLCGLAGVNKATVNKLSAMTANQVFTETLPRGGDKPLQVLTTAGEPGEMIRSIHGASYTRLYDADLLSMVREFATDFQPPQQGNAGRADSTASDDDVPFEPDAEPTAPRGTGLYRGEQDMFVFLIDPMGWTEIDGQAFAPGFFLWNSEVGKRSVGIQTFWFQAICKNHIVWDAVEVVEFSRKHTANVHEAFSEIRRIVERLVATRDERRDGFARVIRKAMESKIGDDADQVLKLLCGKGITRTVAKEALEIAKESGRFTVFSLVDALTRISGRMKFAGERTDADAKASALLALAV
ncbi:MAG: DUF932 domain-containing protein [Phycisphaerales bacterium]|nr:DUF932 domain-containing protein [Phycisphaerales bacterium]